MGIGIVLNVIGCMLMISRNIIGTKRGWRLYCFLALYSDFFFIAGNIVLELEIIVFVWILSLVASVLSIIGFATGILVLKEREE